MGRLSTVGFDIYIVQRLRAIASSAMPKQRWESIRDQIKARLSLFKRPVPTRSSSPSRPLGVPPALSEGSPAPAPPPRPSAEPSPGGTFGIFVDGAGPPQTTVKLAGDVAYKGFKALLDVLDTVGYAVPPMKAAAAGLSKVMALIDVCTATSQWVTVGTNESHETESRTE